MPQATVELNESFIYGIHPRIAKMSWTICRACGGKGYQYSGNPFQGNVPCRACEGRGKIWHDDPVVQQPVIIQGASYQPQPTYHPQPRPKTQAEIDAEVGALFIFAKHPSASYAERLLTRRESHCTYP